MGQTTSTNFPTVAPLQAANGGQENAFLTRVNSTGSAYLYSTYLGGSQAAIGMAVAVDSSGNADVAGYTYGNFPVTPGALSRHDRRPNECLCGHGDDCPAADAGVLRGGRPAPGRAGQPAANVAYCATCQAPVNPLTGTTVVQTPTVESDGFDPMTPDLDWTNGANDPPGNGSGMFDTDEPYLIQVNGGSTIIVVTGGFDAEYFDLSGGVYTPRFYSQDQLTHNSGAHEFVYTDTAGDSIDFEDFSTSLPLAQRGTFNAFVDPAGNVTQVTAPHCRRPDRRGPASTDDQRHDHHRVVPLHLHRQRRQRRAAPDVTLRRQVNGGAVDHRPPGGLHLLRRHPALRQRGRP